MNETITISMPLWVAWLLVGLGVLSLIDTILKIYIIHLQKRLASLGKAGG